MSTLERAPPIKANPSPRDPPPSSPDSRGGSGNGPWTVHRHSGPSSFISSASSRRGVPAFARSISEVSTEVVGVLFAEVLLERGLAFVFIAAMLAGLGVLAWMPLCLEAIIPAHVNRVNVAVDEHIPG